VSKISMIRSSLFLSVVLVAGNPRAEPILHEYVPPPGKSSAGSWARRGRLPPSIRVDDRTLAQPRDPLGARPGVERTLETPADRRRRRFVPDRSTRQDGVLHYQAVFNPSVVPFKRDNALDAVGPGYVLRVRDERLVPLSLTHTAPAPDRDLFWGSVALRFRPGQAVPIPSVAPSAQIRSYTTTPQVRVQFFRDSGDNFWARARGYSGPLRLIFLTDAPKRYFSPHSLPPTVTTADVPPALRPQLPPSVRSTAQQVIVRVGVKRNATIRRQLDRLVAYFRNFEPGRLPRITGDTYLDIALSQQGVCRHRAFAFVVTAQALGLPARFVHNDAHAFTEVFVPRFGWIRVDLGGASQGLQVHNGARKAVHNPGPDPFPRPSRFARNYSRLSGPGVRGIRPSQRLRPARRRVALRRYDRSRGASGGPGSAAAGGRGTGPAVASPSAEGEAMPSDAVDPDAPPPAPRKTRTQIVVYTTARTVYRGERLSVWGKVVGGGTGAAGLRVEIVLSEHGQEGDLLGAVVTDADGNFRAALPVQRTVKVGRYRVYAATPGDRRYEPSRSR
jgi:transglutaminase-like putative cysteine protease